MYEEVWGCSGGYYCGTIGYVSFEIMSREVPVFCFWNDIGNFALVSVLILLSTIFFEKDISLCPNSSALHHGKNYK